ncbi:hypothetical protein Vafri_5292 [Volvox africanus]|uniref:Uncharacterized protein n=1 Tax=Volvox africanus TaxID=51714 RepID=A0A8J4EWW3_9CHLO|nr:hypothetical protein Vafri_5292 [Volvox africanus]
MHWRNRGIGSWPACRFEEKGGSDQGGVFQLVERGKKGASVQECRAACAKGSGVDCDWQLLALGNCEYMSEGRVARVELAVTLTQCALSRACLNVRSPALRRRRFEYADHLAQNSRGSRPTLFSKGASPRPLNFGPAASTPQRGMVVMWISLVVASLRLGRLKDVAWTCSQDVPARAPEFGRTSVLRSTGSWGLRLTNWALGLSGWGNTPSGTNARVTNTDSSWSSWGWNQMASLLSSRLYPSFLKTALCYVQELGLQAFGILLVVFLLHPLLRSMLSVNMRHSWRIDVPVILGGLWAVAGCVTIHCLGGHWTVWLAGWWIWCGTGYVMHMKELLSGWAKVAVAVFLVGAPVVIIGAAFVAPALQVHGFVQG